MKIQLCSETRVGKWAAGLTLLFILLMILRFPSPVAAGIGVAGFAMGLFSIVKNKDRSLFVLLSIPIGLLIILWVTAEIAFPH